MYFPTAKWRRPCNRWTLPASTKLRPEGGPRGLPAGGKQSLPCRINRQFGQRICAGIESGELPERRHAGRAAINGGIQGKGAGHAGGEAASRLRGELGESLATVQRFDVPLAEATTSSLEALQAYSLGVKATREKRAYAALLYDQRAIDLDPSFALGYRAVGGDYDVWDSPGGRVSITPKLFSCETVPAREKSWISPPITTPTLPENWRRRHKPISSDHKLPRHLQRMAIWPTFMLRRESTSKQWRKPAKAYVLIPVTLAATKTPPTFRSPCSDSMTRSRHLSRRKRAIWMTSSCAIACTLWLSFSETIQPWRRNNNGLREGRTSIGALRCKPKLRLMRANCAAHQELTRLAVNSAIRAEQQRKWSDMVENSAVREAAFGNFVDATAAATQGLKLAPASPGAMAEARWHLPWQTTALMLNLWRGC